MFEESVSPHEADAVVDKVCLRNVEMTDWIVKIIFAHASANMIERQRSHQMEYLVQFLRSAGNQILLLSRRMRKPNRFAAQIDCFRSDATRNGRAPATGTVFCLYARSSSPGFEPLEVDTLDV